MGFKTSLADARLRRAFHRRMKPLKLRPVDFTILLILANNEAVNQKALCQALDMSAPGLAVILDRLQARELLVRERNELDKREHRLALTANGLALAQEAARLSEDVETKALQALTPSEQATLARLLNKMLYGAAASQTAASSANTPRKNGALITTARGGASSSAM